MESNEHAPMSSASQDTTTGSSQGAKGSYAFLVHSQDSVGQITPPQIEDQRLARQKRRRTSPEDHAILEAEYERNSKPDKAARVDIVNRVSLGEKEVQIWFQNRRQMTRRKSRPLLPHEVFSNLQSSQEDAGHASSSSLSANESSEQQHSSSQSTAFPSQSMVQSLHTTWQVKAPVDAVVNESATLPEIGGSLGGNDVARGPGNISEGSAKPSCTSASFDNKDDTGQASITSLIRSLSQTASTKRRPGYLANRRSASFVIHDESRNGLSPSSLASSLPSIGPAKGASDVSGSAQTLKRASSHVRLSMSLDGKAEVTTRTGNTPSPPRSQPVPTAINPVPRPKTSLQRSYSALEPGNKSVPNKSVSDVVPVLYTRRSMTGRSRDARTWEFYCDSDARNALTEQAEREESGSATAAIGLIRSQSNNNKVMTPNPNKRNAHSQKPDSTKRLKADVQRTGKPKLARAISSVARLQTANSNGQTQKAMKEGEKKLKGASQSAMWQEYEGDSDKENWEPGTQSSNPRRRRPRHSHQAVCILEESFRVPSQSSSLDAMMNSESTTSRRSNTKSSSSEEKENSGPEVDDEIAAFMEESGPRGVEDLDCVQNLLSLSQAAWQ
ncbi:hypothetical protein HO133_004663 [Letharia lupina]|uniref:Homeobox domain-containing protein n=1 Tax=Letharia lupina TaxID=560253 RepID=A0A8H6KZW4_9LECA|nr:uncharacterized protein HO133_004663 [Letharia lupina]KAF6230323.1 hypothetical protein HO133_004663 [Letharia lupina]